MQIRNFMYLKTYYSINNREISGIHSDTFCWYYIAYFVAGFISMNISMLVSLQERSDLLGCTNRGWRLYSSATIGGFCYESSARWLLWDTAVQDFCVYWWTHFCGRGELLLDFIIILLIVTAELAALNGFWRFQIAFLFWITYHDWAFFVVFLILSR